MSGLVKRLKHASATVPICAEAATQIAELEAQMVNLQSAYDHTIEDNVDLVRHVVGLKEIVFDYCLTGFDEEIKSAIDKLETNHD